MSVGDLNRYMGRNADEVEEELKDQGFKINSQRRGKYSTGGLDPDTMADPTYIMVTRNDDGNVLDCQQLGPQYMAMLEKKREGL